MCGLMKKLSNVKIFLKKLYLVIQKAQVIKKDPTV